MQDGRRDPHERVLTAAQQARADTLKSVGDVLAEAMHARKLDISAKLVNMAASAKAHAAFALRPYKKRGGAGRNARCANPPPGGAGGGGQYTRG